MQVKENIVPVASNGQCREMWFHTVALCPLQSLRLGPNLSLCALVSLYDYLAGSE